MSEIGICLGALISSKINQWTLLVGAIPLVYAISKVALEPMILDHWQFATILPTVISRWLCCGCYCRDSGDGLYSERHFQKGVEFSRTNTREH
ncbi:MAG TPA: hypothetical protein VE961_00610 [Pyrinomonadaceae bacterium]|nr:hypothetical protein [Pyrinomonadaceae bacterium]